MSGLDRFLAVLRLFGEAKSTWTVADMAEVLGLPASTVYRTVRDLVGADFLETAHEAHYRLGAAFVEFDRMIRLTDPLARAGEALLGEIGLQARVPCVIVLARLYGNTVMCVADQSAGETRVRTSYERGRPMPLLRGATSKMVLAQLPGRRLKKLLSQIDPATAGSFAPTGSELTEELAAARRRGFCITRGEVDRDLVGLAAPVAAPEIGIVASLSLIVRAKDIESAIERRLTLLLVSSASLLTEDLKASASAIHSGVRTAV